MSKVVFFDIDGTLLDHDKNLPVETKAAIRQLQKNGTYVAIATGRAPFMFESLRKELSIDSYVSFNGQYVVFENKVIYTNPLNMEPFERLLHDASLRSHPIVYLNEETMKGNVPHHHFIEKSMESLKFTHPDFEADFYKEKEIYQSLLFCEEGQEDYFREKYRDLHFIRWHPYSVDILPGGGSKAEGIKQMIKQLGFALEDVYAFGDGLNDIEMIQAVGTGVVMGNATEAVKKHADFLTKDVSEQGIPYALKELGLL
ncbi:Cof-type HAD-IIB family hydrolase [Bacillus spongiae]|uniref:Cof-type HAD-IIB family hydrolase n=1 Tax=Bacillus spongiae TaxID=2683610 RepID=A0ABU8H9Q1_9BACI